MIVADRDEPQTCPWCRALLKITRKVTPYRRSKVRECTECTYFDSMQDEVTFSGGDFSFLKIR